MTAISHINKIIDNNNFSYYGIMSACIMIGSCIASGAVIAILANDGPLWQLYVVVCLGMASNAASISHSPLRWVVWTFIINVLASLVLIAIHIF